MPSGKGLRQHVRSTLLTLSLLAGFVIASPAQAADWFVQGDLGATTLKGHLINDLGDHIFDLDLANLGYSTEFMGGFRGGVQLGRHRLQGSAFFMSNGIDETLEIIEIGDDTFNIGAKVDNKASWGEFEYGYSIINNPKWRLEALVGLRLFNYTLDVEGSASLGGETVTETFNGDITAPLPHIGAAGNYWATEQVVIRAAIKGFWIGIDDSKGDELDGEFFVGVKVHKNVEIGGGYRGLMVTVDLDNLQPRIDLDYRGLMGYVRYTFGG